MSWRNFGCNNFDKNASRPLSIFNNQDLFSYIKEYNIDYCVGWYGKPIPNQSGGYKWSLHQRSGCYGCPIGFTDDVDEVAEIQEFYPDLYKKLSKINGYLHLYNYTKNGRKGYTNLFF